MGDVASITDSPFDAQVFKTDIPVLVEFRAAWCEACRAVTSMLDEIARQYVGRLKVAEIDVDRSGQAAFRHRVSSIPTLILFANGQEVERLDGKRAASREEVLSRVLPYLYLD